MNVKEFVDEIAREFGYTKEESNRILDFFMDTVRKELSQGREVKIRNFGTFRRYETKSEKCVAKFYSSKNFFKNV